MKKINLCLALVCFFGLKFQAQNPISLKRFYFNGFAAAPINDSLAKLYNYPNKSGLLVTRLVDNGSATKAGVKVNDIVFKVNGIAVQQLSDLKKGQLANLREDQEIVYDVWRGQRLITLKTIAVARAKEQKAGINYTYGQVNYKNGFLRSIVSNPISQSRRLPAVLFIQGYTCSSVVDFDEKHPYRRLTDGLTEGGYIVMRVEKPGIGESENTPPCQDIDFYEETQAFENALLQLKKNPNVDTNNIFIWGHSLGGLIAPMLTSKYPWIKGAIVYGTVQRFWGEYILNMVRIQSAGFGMPPLEVEKTVKAMRKIIYEVYTMKKDPKKLIKEDPSLKPYLETQLQWNENDNKIFTRSVAFNQTLDDVNITELWSKTESKVMAFYGEADIEALSDEGAKAIINTVNNYHPGNGTYTFLNGTDHAFAKVGTIEDGYKTKADPNYYKIMIDNFNPKVIELSVSWLNSVYKPTEFKFNSANTQNNQADTLQWKKLNTESSNAKQDDICFINQNTGWYCNGQGKIYQTNNGGITWNKIYEKPGTFFRCLNFIDSLRGFVGNVGTDYFPNVADTIPLYQTNDGGKTWSPVSYKGPYVKGLCAIDVVKEQYVNHGNIDYKYHIYAVGRVGSPANILVSHDSGKSFTSWSLNNDCKMLFDIKMFNINEGFVCAATNEDISLSNALVMYTKDGGKTWTKAYQSQRPFETTWKLSFPTRNIGYVTIQSYNPDPSVKQQKVAKTIDGGKTWTELYLCEDATAREFGVGFINEKVGFVGTMTSGFKTIDGGVTWEKIDLGRACNKIRIYKTSTGKPYGYSIGVNVYKLSAN